MADNNTPRGNDASITWPLNQPTSDIWDPRAQKASASWCITAQLITRKMAGAERFILREPRHLLSKAVYLRGFSSSFLRSVAALTPSIKAWLMDIDCAEAAPNLPALYLVATWSILLFKTERTLCINGFLFFLFSLCSNVPWSTLLLCVERRCIN